LEFQNPDYLKEFLEEKYLQYNCARFIESDPISIPYLFSKKENIEISAFLTAIISWGQRPTIIRNAKKLMSMMDENPYDFIMNGSREEFGRFSSFVHRTFNGIDCRYFIDALSEIYHHYGGLEEIFTKGYRADQSMKSAIGYFRKTFLSFSPPVRTAKHIANPEAGSSAKRINMFLRWMIRKPGIDFGLWDWIPASALMMPIDVHSGNVARKLGLLQRKQNDWRAVEELTQKLRQFDAADPVKYDFALFGLGIFEKF
jgi:uncharacterized protein (TIGR02757 family)